MADPSVPEPEAASAPEAAPLGSLDRTWLLEQQVRARPDQAGRRSSRRSARQAWRLEVAEHLAALGTEARADHALLLSRAERLRLAGTEVWLLLLAAVPILLLIPTLALLRPGLLLGALVLVLILAAILIGECQSERDHALLAARQRMTGGAAALKAKPEAVSGVPGRLP